MRVMDISEARPKRNQSAFTLAEVVIAIAIMGMVFSGTIYGYVQASKRAQWSGYSLAAQALATQQIEQVRGAAWDWYKGSDDSTNIVLNSWSYNYSSKVLTGYSWTNLDIPYSGTNYVRCTNYVTVTLLSINNTVNPPVQVRMVQVDAVWPFTWGNATKYFTNTLVTYCAPDN